jgi:hypothetical protein
MADLHSEFKTFYSCITLTSDKKESLRKSRDVLRKRIRKHFQDELELTAPKFYGQGSYAMSTTVNPLSGEFDIDDGVYLQHLDAKDKSEWPTPETVHRWLVRATDGHTNKKPIDKRTCVRVRYAGEYHVDLPAYSEFNEDYWLSEKGDKGWHKSDPREITDWFKDCVNEQGGQLRRMVRYLKAWADFQSGRRGKMPNGLILTVLIVNNYCESDRDDIAFADTIYSIANDVSDKFCIYNPVDDEEELTGRLTDVQMIRFQDAISEMDSDAEQAIDTDDSEKASKLWRKQFGDRFPSVEDVQSENEKKETAAKLASVYAVKKQIIKPWCY